MDMDKEKFQKLNYKILQIILKLIISKHKYLKNCVKSKYNVTIYQ